MLTPDFPIWAGGFAAQYRRLRTTTGTHLHQLEAIFGAWIARYLLAQREHKAFSRDRGWNLRLVFWTFLWQVAQPGSACREAIRQAQSACRLLGRKVPPDQNSPYCTARARLPMEALEEIHRAVAGEAERAVASKDLWLGLCVRVVDASTVIAPDTAANQKAFPQSRKQRPGCGFPLIHIIGLFSLATGLFLAWATGSQHVQELVLLQSLWQHLRAGDLLLGDRGFAAWGTLAQCCQRGIHGVFRVRGRLRTDWRRGQRLSKHDRRVVWKKPRQRPSYFTAEQWAQFPEQLILRVVRVVVTQRGFRARKIILVTTLLDDKAYPPEALAELYRRRWDMELSLRHLKTTLQMEQLSCKTPSNLQRELWMHFCMHNLVRRLMFEAARKANVPLHRLSFAGALAATRRYSETLLQARSARKRKALLAELLRVLAEDLVPDRPGRREPRAVKKRPKSYPRLTFPRSEFQPNREISPRQRRKKSRR
jgi:hypothetical protein